MTQHLITEPAKLQACRRCGAYTITATTGGVNISADLQPLSVDAEIATLLSGAATFDFHPVGSRYYLEQRDIFRIRAGREYPVVTVHKCTPINPPPKPKPDIPLTNIRYQPLPDDPPF